MSALVPVHALALVFAHQGGWDEMLFVLVPISVFAWLLSLANKRATREQEQADEPESSPPDDEPG